ncbi:hypothetical protein [Streptomyces sp. NPDC001604]|uniref:hypothetical protein n=1 Tax=Streptomyces sp. NPDC001604 TaxID=3364593 RepID=UPI00369E0C31
MLFRCVMVLLVVFFAVRTCEETAIAVARGTGGLDTVDAVVVEAGWRSHEGCSGAGQDTNCTEQVTWSSREVGLRVDGDTRTVSLDGDGPSFTEGQKVRLGLWHNKVVEINGYLVHSAWKGDGFFFVVPLMLYPLAMGYVVVVVTALLARLMNRGRRARLDLGKRIEASASGVVVGLVVCLFLVFFSAIREASPPWWPIAPVGAGSAVAALVLVIKARRATESMPVTA